MKKLFLHIGTHKTGSTSVQKFCEANRGELEKRGLFYPDYQPFVDKAPYAHHQFSKAVSGQGRELDYSAAEQLAEQWDSYCEDKGLNLLISAEPMYRLELRDSASSRDVRRENYFRKIQLLFPNFQIQPIVVFRRPDSLIESLYRENVMTNHPSAKVDFTTFIEENYKRFFSYGTTVEILQKVFQRMPQVYIFESLIKNETPVEHFFLSQLGCNVEDLSPIGQVRRSLNNAQLIVKRMLNESIESEKDSNRITAWLKLPETEAILEEALQGYKKSSLWRRGEREKCWRLAEEELSILQEKIGGNVYKAEGDISINDEEYALKPPGINQFSKILIAALKYDDYKKLPSSSKAYRV